MIARPAGWTAVPGVTTQMLISPEGADAAGIRYSERIRPLKRVGDIIEDWLAQHRRLTLVSVGRAERLVTTEGEHAAIVTIDGAFDGNAIQTTLGVVFGDDFYARLEGFALRKELFASTRAMVRELTLNDSHVLGRQRRRRYEYSSPQNWQPIVRGFTTDWLAPGFPKRNGILVAYAAAPNLSGDEIDLGSLATRAVERGFAAESSSEPLDVQNEAGLVGVVNELTGSQGERAVLRSFVTLTDHRFLYSAELLARTEADWTAHKEAFGRLWQSIVPIPSFKPATPTVAFEFWAE